MANKIYITSDLHFGHNKLFLYGPRGYANIESHDEDIIKNWNNLIDNEDDIYILGDLMLNDNEAGIEKIKQLNGKIHIILGNHDSDTRIKLYKENGLDVIGHSTYLKYKKYHFYLSHYPSITSNYDINRPLKLRVINLCGHTHTCNKFHDINKGTIYHCELDAHNMMPVCIDTIIEDLKQYELEEEVIYNAIINAIK